MQTITKIGKVESESKTEPWRNKNTNMAGVPKVCGYYD